ncbi:MAG: DUF1622 domain-containing protein [Chloroflexi bacterium]|nr:DUF1622 domain-containing protein [Chloroflexota bacterium]
MVNLEQIEGSEGKRVQQALDYIALGIGSIAGLIIIYGVVLGTGELVRHEWRRFATDEEKAFAFEKVRYDIGFHLLLGLEFLIAADIMRTIVRPSLEELAILGGIVAIRTVISYFLGKEIDRGRRGSSK